LIALTVPPTYIVFWLSTAHRAPKQKHTTSTIERDRFIIVPLRNSKYLGTHRIVYRFLLCFISAKYYLALSFQSATVPGVPLRQLGQNAAGTNCVPNRLGIVSAIPKQAGRTSPP